MADAFQIRIDVELVRRNFEKAEGREWTADQVVEWLGECGIKPIGGLWVAEEISLDVLDKTEFKIVKRL